MVDYKDSSSIDVSHLKRTQSKMLLEEVAQWGSQW
jgi:hypothetical protein